MSFDIDANGILHVGAKDKATGKENKITIKANSGLTEAEIQSMVRDAAAHAEEDRRVKELVDSRNGGDALVHATRKLLADLGDRLDADDRSSVEAAIAALESALKTDNKADIDARAAALSAAAHKLSEKAYAASPGEQTAQAGTAGPRDGQAQNDDVVDADFREVKR